VAQEISHLGGGDGFPAATAPAAAAGAASAHGGGRSEDAEGGGGEPRGYRGSGYPRSKP
jgi:hypothetical protein